MLLLLDFFLSAAPSSAFFYSVACSPLAFHRPTYREEGEYYAPRDAAYLAAIAYLDRERTLDPCGNEIDFNRTLVAHVRSGDIFSNKTWLAKASKNLTGALKTGDENVYTRHRPYLVTILDNRLARFHYAPACLQHLNAVGGPIQRLTTHDDGCNATLLAEECELGRC